MLIQLAVELARSHTVWFVKGRLAYSPHDRGANTVLQ